MYPTFTCKCDHDRFSPTANPDCPCQGLLPKAGDILEDKDGNRTLVRGTYKKSVQHYHSCGCCRGKVRHEYHILIDGEPTEVISTGGGTVFSSTLETHYEWPPTDHKLIRDGVVIYAETTT